MIYMILRSMILLVQLRGCRDIGDTPTVTVKILALDRARRIRLAEGEVRLWRQAGPQAKFEICLDGLFYTLSLSHLFLALPKPISPFSFLSRLT